MYNSDFNSYLSKLYKLDHSLDALSRYNTIKNKVKQGYINIDNLQQAESYSSLKSLYGWASNLNESNDPTYFLYHKYSFDLDEDVLRSIDAIIECGEITLSYTIFNSDTKQYEKHNQTFSFQDLLNQKVTTQLTEDLNHQYYFQVNNLEIHRYKDQYNYIAESNQSWDNAYSTNHIVADGDHYILNQPIYVDATFDDLSSDLKGFYPSYLSKDMLINQYIHLIDDQGINTKISTDDYGLVDLVPDDVHGTLKVVVHTNNGEKNFTYSGLKQFDINQFDTFDIAPYHYGQVASDMTIDEAKELLLSSQFDQSILDESTLEINQVDDTNGTATLNISGNNYQINKSITFTGFAPCTISQVNNEKILKNYQPSKVTKQMVKDYLLSPSLGFKNKYGDDYQLTLSPHDQNHTLDVTINNQDELLATYTYTFANTKSIMNYICVGVILLGIIGVITFLILQRKQVMNKKIKQ